MRAKIQETLGVLLDTYDVYFLKPAESDPSKVFSRSLSYVAYARALLASMQEPMLHTEALREVCRLIASFERINASLDGRPQSGFVMGTEHDALPYVDCHATCLLALARGVELLGNADWIDAIDRGLVAFCLDTQRFEFCGDRIIDVVGVDYLAPSGVRHKLETFWNFKAGLCLQLFSALRDSPSEALRQLWEKHRGRLEILEAVARARIERSMRHHEDGVEILTSMLSAETNSETQPWVALGLIGQQA